MQWPEPAAPHDFLADNAQKLAREDDVLMQGNGIPELERYREERAAVARLDRLKCEGQLLPRDEVREALGLGFGPRGFVTVAISSRPVTHYYL